MEKTTEYWDELNKKIESRDARVCVIGLGYVGLPLAIESCKTGFFVDGYDISKNKVQTLSKGLSDIDDIPSELVRKYIDNGRFFPTTDPDIIKRGDIVIICVPTPLSKFKEPDISYIEDATEKIAKNLHKGMLIILESTTYPGTTEEILKPRFEKEGYKIGEDIFLAFSPERVDPGNPKYHTGNTPKVVGGVSERCSKLAYAFYSTFLELERVILVSSPTAAETVKLLENTFRSVNIALVNEFAMICEQLGLDIWEIIEAASTKPFGFMPFYPGPGVGGHCIPIDPHYLSWKLRAYNFYAHFIELAGEVNYRMPEYVVDRIIRHINNHGKILKGLNVLILGVSYKKNISDVRESPALDVMKLLEKGGAIVQYNDPFVPKIKWENGEKKSTELTENLLRSIDLVVLTTEHDKYDYSWIAKHANLIFDTRNAFANIPDPDRRIARLGVGTKD